MIHHKMMHGKATLVAKREVATIETQTMNKAFTRENDAAEDDDGEEIAAPPLAAGREELPHAARASSACARS